MSRRARLSLPFVSVLMALLLAPAIGRAATTDAEVQRGLRGLVAAEGRTSRRDRDAVPRREARRRCSAGRSDIERRGAPTATQHMRIASIAKAFSGAVALHLVAGGQAGPRRHDRPAAPGPADGMGGGDRPPDAQPHERPPGLHAVRRASRSRRPRTRRATSRPREIIDWVRNVPLEFTPGSKYEYSNTDNIVVGLIAETVSGTPYPTLLKNIVFGPAGLTQTSFPTRRISLPAPYIHGYVVNPPHRPAGRHALPQPERRVGIRRDRLDPDRPRRVHPRRPRPEVLRRRRSRREQMKFVPGSSSPPGPGTNAAGLALFRYTTSCGVVYGHTGNFPGYVQWAAATADGTRSVTTSAEHPRAEGRAAPPAPRRAGQGGLRAARQVGE